MKLSVWDSKWDIFLSKNVDRTENQNMGMNLKYEKITNGRHFDA